VHNDYVSAVPTLVSVVGLRIREPVGTSPLAITANSATTLTARTGGQGGGLGNGAVHGRRRPAATPAPDRR
jgi:hypothetical protein